MLNTTTFAIVSCVLGFPLLETSHEPPTFVPSSRAETQTSSSKAVTTLYHAVSDRAFDDEILLSAPFDHLPGLAMPIQNDQRFWAVYRDYDPDADSMLGWHLFQRRYPDAIDGD